MICGHPRRFSKPEQTSARPNLRKPPSINQSEFFVDRPAKHGGPQRPDFYQKVIEDQFLNDLAWELKEKSRPSNALAMGPTGYPTRRNQRQAFRTPGAIGTLTVSLSNSPEADDAGFRVVTCDQGQIRPSQAPKPAPLSRGADLPPVREKHLDSRNAKAPAW